jgi:hypothetical protein
MWAMAHTYREQHDGERGRDLRSLDPRAANVAEFCDIIKPKIRMGFKANRSEPREVTVYGMATC